LNSLFAETTMFKQHSSTMNISKILSAK